MEHGEVYRNIHEPRPLKVLFKLMHVTEPVRAGFIHAYGELPDHPTVQRLGRHMATLIERMLVIEQDYLDSGVEIRLLQREGWVIPDDLLARHEDADIWHDHYGGRIAFAFNNLSDLMNKLEARETACTPQEEQEGAALG